MKNKIIFFALACSMSSAALGFSFTESSRRYLAPTDLINMLQHLLPRAPGPEAMACTTINSNNLYLLGGNKPVDGQPLLEKPSDAFVQWWSGCVSKGIDANVKISNINTFLSSTTMEQVTKITPLNNAVGSLQWSSIPDELKTAIILDIIDYAGLKDVLPKTQQDLMTTEITASVSKYVEKNGSPTIQLTDVLKKILFFTLMRDEAIRA